ncbi:hypothetical protein [Cupriavidus sp. IDO]|uniref:hypothetical protein n=1 Tax=Cupriavidus sp. IDO TaxID=1539142 RepID=UPI000B0B865D|nr:hypothetical protein [Cupriavidus sp. IDO]
MVATLTVALLLIIGLALCAVLVIWTLREKNPTLLSAQEQSVRNWFDHLIHRH